MLATEDHEISVKGYIDQVVEQVSKRLDGRLGGIESTVDKIEMRQAEVLKVISGLTSRTECDKREGRTIKLEERVEVLEKENVAEKAERKVYMGIFTGIFTLIVALISVLVRLFIR